MTLPKSGPALAAALRRARENIERGSWPDRVEEAAWDPALHPRSRVGRFLDVPDWAEADEPDEPENLKLYDGSRTPRREDRLPMPKFSPEVRKIKTASDAERYLRKLGINAELRPNATEGGHPDGREEAPSVEMSPVERNAAIANDGQFWRQIAQAVTDAMERYPVLKREAEADALTVKFSEPSDPAYTENRYIWGSTTTDLDETTILLHANNTKLTTKYDPLGGTKILPGDKIRGGTSIATQIPYGRMMHELGHAVARSSGLTDEYRPEKPVPRGLADLLGTARGELYLLEDAQLSPQLAKLISFYGASDPGELVAELFANINTQGAMDEVDSELERAERSDPRVEGARTMLSLTTRLARDLANTWGMDRGVGRIL